MKRIVLFLFLSALVSSSLMGQTIGTASARGAVPAQSSDLSHEVIQSGISGATTAAQKIIPIRYFDETALPALQWRVQATYTDFTMLNIGQRFTLPTETGYLDSLAVLIYELPIGEIRFEVWKDTLYQRILEDPRLYHYPNIFGGVAALIDTARLSSANRNPIGFTMIRFNKKEVPKEFHISISPTTVGGFQSMFGILTDSQKGDDNTITPENARTHFLYVDILQNVGICHMHGFFEYNSQPIAPMLYMIAYVDVEGSTGTKMTPVPTETRLHQNYPNPFFSSVSQSTELSFDLSQAGYVTLEVYDAIGRRVRTLVHGYLEGGTHSRTFHAAGLPPGMYHYRLFAGGSQISRSMMYVK